MPANGNQPSTPRKQSDRPTQRHIVRWTDEKLAYVFAEMRIACQKYRIDIKKPMDDAAKKIGPHVTGDALIQQLTKRRARYLEEQGKEDEGGEAEAPPSSIKKGCKPLVEGEVAAASSPASASRKRATPKRAKTTALQREVADLGDTPSTNASPADSIEIATNNNTPASTATKRKPRGTPRGGSTKRKNSTVQVKKEDTTSPQTLSDGSDSDDEYTESPSKAKKKRVRTPRSRAKKAQPVYYDEEVFGGEQEQEHDSEEEEEYVDEAGGTNVVIHVTDHSSPATNTSSSPETVGRGRRVTLKANPSMRRGDSHQRASTSPRVAVGAEHGQVEDVFVDRNGVQQFVAANMAMPYGSGGGFDANGYIGYPQMMQQAMPNGMYYNQHMFGMNMMGHNDTLTQSPVHQDNSDPSTDSSQEQVGLHESFNTMPADNNSFAFAASFANTPSFTHSSDMVHQPFNNTLGNDGAMDEGSFFGEGAGFDGPQEVDTPVGLGIGMAGFAT